MKFKPPTIHLSFRPTAVGSHMRVWTSLNHLWQQYRNVFLKLAPLIQLASSSQDYPPYWTPTSVFTPSRFTSSLRLETINVNELNKFLVMRSGLYVPSGSSSSSGEWLVGESCIICAKDDVENRSENGNKRCFEDGLRHIPGDDSRLGCLTKGSRNVS